ncbi:DUF2509 family protein [Orbaceae bacterium ESL0727]|nr:DUF2509 family protein [Orbaceae bacterium ESL0727]
MKIFNVIVSSRLIATNQQVGLSAIAMVMILMLLGIILLTGFHSLITSWQKSIVSELHYYARFNQASSALHWGSRQIWAEPTANWQCQIETNNQLHACIKSSSLTTDRYTLLRGGSADFYLYQLTHYDNGKLKIEHGHWLDYCPEKRNMDCN